MLGTTRWPKDHTCRLTRDLTRVTRFSRCKLPLPQQEIPPFRSAGPLEHNWNMPLSHAFALFPGIGRSCHPRAPGCHNKSLRVSTRQRWTAVNRIPANLPSLTLCFVFARRDATVRTHASSTGDFSGQHIVRSHPATVRSLASDFVGFLGTLSTSWLAISFSCLRLRPSLLHHIFKHLFLDPLHFAICQDSDVHRLHADPF